MPRGSVKKPFSLNTAIHTPIAGTEYDRRAKLTPDQKKEIIIRYFSKKGDTYLSLSKEYKVSPSAIRFTIYPEKNTGGNRDGKFYSQKEKYKKEKESRLYKLSLLRQGKIKGEI